MWFVIHEQLAKKSPNTDCRKTSLPTVFNTPILRHQYKFRAEAGFMQTILFLQSYRCMQSTCTCKKIPLPPHNNEAKRDQFEYETMKTPSVRYTCICITKSPQFYKVQVWHILKMFQLIWTCNLQLSDIKISPTKKFVEYSMCVWHVSCFSVSLAKLPHKSCQTHEHITKVQFTTCPETSQLATRE